jgi:hypothetical protein
MNWEARRKHLPGKTIAMLLITTGTHLKKYRQQL